MNETLEQATIRFPSPVPPAYSGTRRLALDFNYPLSQGLSGFYRSTHQGDAQHSLLWPQSCPHAPAMPVCRAPHPGMCV